jgi:hypothetical protein
MGKNPLILPYFEFAFLEDLRYNNNAPGILLFAVRCN